LQAFLSVIIIYALKTAFCIYNFVCFSGKCFWHICAAKDVKGEQEMRNAELFLIYESLIFTYYQLLFPNLWMFQISSAGKFQQYECDATEMNRNTKAGSIKIKTLNKNKQQIK
jgi:hypothetical protein